MGWLRGPGRGDTKKVSPHKPRDGISLTSCFAFPIWCNMRNYAHKLSSNLFKLSRYHVVTHVINSLKPSGKQYISVPENYHLRTFFIWDQISICLCLCSIGRLWILFLSWSKASWLFLIMTNEMLFLIYFIPLGPNMIALFRNMLEMLNWFLL